MMASAISADVSGPDAIRKASCVSRDKFIVSEIPSPAAEASANKGSARTGTDVCERRWWNSPGCGCAGSHVVLGSAGFRSDHDAQGEQLAKPRQEAFRSVR